MVKTVPMMATQPWKVAMAKWEAGVQINLLAHANPDLLGKVVQDAMNLEAAKDKLRSEFESEATHSAFAPGKKMTPRFRFKVARLDNQSEDTGSSPVLLRGRHVLLPGQVSFQIYFEW